MGRRPVLVRRWRLAGVMSLGTILVLSGCSGLVTPEMEARAKAVESVKVSLSNIPGLLATNAAALLEDPKSVRVAKRGDDSEDGLRLNILLPPATTYSPADLTWGATIYGLVEGGGEMTASLMVVGYGNAGTGWVTSTVRLASCVSAVTESRDLTRWNLSNTDCPPDLVKAKAEADGANLEVIAAPLDPADG